MKKAIIFDFGGVLLDLDIEAAWDKFRSIGFDDITEYLDPYHQKGFFGDLEAGKISPDEFYKIILESHSLPGTTVDDILDCYDHFIKAIEPQKAEYLKDLAKRGYDLYMLSNNNSVAMTVCRRSLEASGLDMDIFRKCFISSEMKLLKPSREIYEAVIREIGLPLDQLLFIDDSQKNVNGALACGIPSLLYIPGDQFKDLIEPEL